MVLSPPSAVSSPSTAFSKVLDLHPPFERATLGFQSDTAAFDATLLLDDLFSSTTTFSGLVNLPTTTTSKESSSDFRMLEETPAGKSLDVLDSAFNSSLTSFPRGNY